MSLDNLLNDAFGTKQKKEQPKNTQKTQTTPRKKRGLYIAKDEAKDLIIALNYAINAIKNKKDVVEKRENSTRYEHFRRWTKIRSAFRKKLAI